jgi:spore maturation protein CgeB
MKIAFFGSSLVSAYWNGAATYYRGIIRALAGRGHDITFYEPDAFDRQAHRDLKDPSWARVVVYDVGDTRGVEAALGSAADADLIVKASGVGVFDALLEAAVLELRRASNMIVFWDVDAPATLERVRTNPDDPFVALIPRYDAIFTYGGGPPVVGAYRERGAQACHPIYNAVDPTTHHWVGPDHRFDGALGLMANRLPDREARVESFFFEVARALADQTFVLGGNGWQDKPLPPNVRALGHVYTRDHNAFNCTPTAVLNINRDSMARCGHSPATRVFEAAGAGACLITDAWAGIERFLEPGREVLIAQDGDAVAEHLRGLTPERAAKVGQAARRRVLAQHTYADRAAEFDTILDCRKGRARCTS